jgi:predicted phage terminase large subunit-like protein
VQDLVLHPKILGAALLASRQEMDRRQAESLRGPVRERCRWSLHEFVREAWHVLEPETKLIDGWHIAAICAHLEAVTNGQITRLLINVPPGSMKSLLVSVFWPAWEWGPRGMAWLRYLSTSFDEDGTKRDTRRMRDLVASEWYQKHWPEVVLERKGETSFSTTRTGSREGAPFGSLTNKRGDRLIIDDPHSTKMAESAAERLATVRQFKEGASNRLNSQVHSAIVVIMQRLHEDDVSGYIIETGGYVVLMLPMEFEKERRCSTLIGFVDPRQEDGEVLSPIQWPPPQIEELKAKGPYFWAGQYQQRPAPRQGGMFQRAWFAEKMVELNEIPNNVTWWRHWDLAATKRKMTDTSGARTAGVLMGRSARGAYYVRHCIAKAIDGNGVRTLIKAQAGTDGIGVGISLPQDPGQSGKVQKGDFASQLAGYNVRFLNEGALGNKEMRAEPFSAQCEAGNVYVVRGGWNEEFFDELCLFPGGKRKDIVDACSGAFARLVPQPGDVELIVGPRVYQRERVVDGYD